MILLILQRHPAELNTNTNKTMKKTKIIIAALSLIGLTAFGQTGTIPTKTLTLVSGAHYGRTQEYDLVFLGNKKDTVYYTQYEYSGSTFYKGAFEFGTGQKSTAGPNPASNEKVQAKYLNKKYIIHYKMDENSPKDTIISKIEPVK